MSRNEEFENAWSLTQLVRDMDRNGNSPLRSKHIISRQSPHFRPFFQSTDQVVAAGVRVGLRLCHRSETRPLCPDLCVSTVEVHSNGLNSLQVLDSAKPPSKGKDGVIQLLDYNISRFDFQDLKGQDRRP